MATDKKLVSMRIRKELMYDIERAAKKFTEERGKGAKPISITETIEILITHGLFRLGIAGDDGGGWEAFADNYSPTDSVEIKKTELRRKLKEEHGIDLSSSKTKKKKG